MKAGKAIPGFESSYYNLKTSMLLLNFLTQERKRDLKYPVSLSGKRR